MRSNQSTFNLFAASLLLKETAINTPQTLSHGLLCDQASMFRFDRRRESNGDEAIGKEEPDALYDLGGMASLDLSFSKCQPQHAIFLAAFGLGSVSTAAGGSTGYAHTITPIAGDLDASRSLPSFTGAMRYGKHLLKERFASCFVDSFRMTFRKDSWLQASGSIKATGLRATNATKETVTAAYNATSLTLAANAVAGSTAQERLDNVHSVRCLVPSATHYVDVTVTAASAATPAVLTITAPGGAATSTSYEIIYNQAESGSYAWCSFPSRVVESPLRIADLTVNVGGVWDGSTITGGHSMTAEVNEIAWEFNNNLAVEFCPGGTGTYANRALRDGRTQKITLDRDFRDYLFGQRLDDNATMVIQAKAQGALYEAGHYYTVQVTWPSVAILSAPYKENGKRLSETIEFAVLEDTTYGSVQVLGKNMIATFAA